MKQYILNHPKGTVIATYTNNGKLKRIEAKKGFLADAAKAGHTFAYTEREIELEHWAIYQPEKDAFFIPAQKEWLAFYARQTGGLNYRFTPIDGKALKEIGKHLTSITANTSEALEVWNFTLKQWDTLDPFYRHKMQLTFINSQLNTILNLIKNGKQAGKAKGTSAADDLRRGFQP